MTRRKAKKPSSKTPQKKKNTKLSVSSVLAKRQALRAHHGPDEAELLTAEQLTKDAAQVTLYRENLKGEREWMRLEMARQNTVVDGLLGAPIADIAGYHYQLTEQLVLAVGSLLRQGATPDAAARALGLPMAKLREWIAVGFKQPNSLAGRLVIMMDRASALAEVEAQRALFKGAPGWQSKLTYLQTMRAKRYAPKVVIESHGIADELEEQVRDKAAQEDPRLKAPDVDTSALVLMWMEESGAFSSPATENPKTTDEAP